MTSLASRLRSTRKYLSPYKRRAGRDDSAGEDSNGSKENLADRLGGLLEIPEVKSFLEDYPREAKAVESEMKELLRTERALSSSTRGAGVLEDERLLAEFRGEDAVRLIQRWNQGSRFRKHLARNYASSEVTLEPFDREASRIRKEPLEGRRQACEAWQQMIVKHWKSVLESKEHKRRVEEEKASDSRIAEQMETLFSRYRRLQQLLEPTQRYLAFSWDLSSAELHESVFDIIQRCEQVMRNRKKIQAVAERLGRLEQAERNFLEQSLAGAPKHEEWVINRAARSSVVGIRESDDISGMVSSEAVLLSSPKTEILFYLRFAEKKLLTYDYQPEEHDRARPLSTRVRKPRVHRRGPIILAVDTSGSMTGESEENAKALALALARIAFSQDRAVHLIAFSREAEGITLSPSKRGSLEQLVRFLLMSFHGGTELDAALRNALGMLKQVAFREADMLFLTDGDAPAFDWEGVAAMNAAREQGARFYSMLVGNGGNRDLLAQFDFNWHYRDGELMDLVGHLERYRLQEL